MTKADYDDLNKKVMKVRKKKLQAKKMKEEAMYIIDLFIFFPP